MIVLTITITIRRRRNTRRRQGREGPVSVSHIADHFKFNLNRARCIQGCPCYDDSPAHRSLPESDRWHMTSAARIVPLASPGVPPLPYREGFHRAPALRAVSEWATACRGQKLLHFLIANSRDVVHGHGVSTNREKAKFSAGSLRTPQPGNCGQGSRTPSKNPFTMRDGSTST